MAPIDALDLARRPASRGAATLAALAAFVLCTVPAAWLAATPAAGQGNPAVQTLRIPADADATLDSASPSPLGASPALTIGHAVGPDAAEMLALLRFPLGALSGDGTVLTATLALDLIAARGGAEVWTRLGTAAPGWREADVTWSSRPSIESPRYYGLLGPKIGARTIEMTDDVRRALIDGHADLNLALSVSPGPLEAGRWRAFASREASGGGGRPPVLEVAYVGAGTPHPYPSATPTERPTSTPTSTGTLPPSPTPTTTSTFGQNQGQPWPLRPSADADLPQPIDGEVWVFEWAQPNHGPCAYVGARVTLFDPLGGTIQRDVTERYDVFASERPVPGGRWQWSVDAHCAHGPTTPSERQAFVVAAAATTEATDTPEPTGAKSVVFAPYGER